MRIECWPARSPRKASNRLPGGTRKSSRFAAWFIIWSFASACLAISMPIGDFDLSSKVPESPCNENQRSLSNCIEARYACKSFLKIYKAKSPKKTGGQGSFSFKNKVNATHAAALPMAIAAQARS